MEYQRDFSLHHNQHLPAKISRSSLLFSASFSSRSPLQQDSHKEKSACENRHKEEVIESALKRTRPILFKGSKFCTQRKGLYDDLDILTVNDFL